jgi:AraC family transcriptional regulator
MSGVPGQWRAYIAHVGEVPNRVGNVTYGLVIDRAEGVDYTPAMEVSGPVRLPAGFSTVSVPAWRYAVFSHDGPVATIRSTVDALWHKWLPKSGRKPVDAGDKPYFFERYGKKFYPAKGEGDIEICIPIEA